MKCELFRQLAVAVGLVADSFKGDGAMRIHEVFRPILRSFDMVCAESAHPFTTRTALPRCHATSLGAAFALHAGEISFCSGAASQLRAMIACAASAKTPAESRACRTPIQLTSAPISKAPSEMPPLIASM